MNNYYPPLYLPDISFNAIKNETKKVEGRVFLPNSPYLKLEPGDTITFINEDCQEKMDVEVIFVHHYQDVQTMLKTEGVKNMSSHGGTIDEIVERYNSFFQYKVNIPKYGIYAFGIKSMGNNQGLDLDVIGLLSSNT